MIERSWTLLLLSACTAPSVQEPPTPTPDRDLLAFQPVAKGALEARLPRAGQGAWLDADGVRLGEAGLRLRLQGLDGALARTAPVLGACADPAARPDRCVQRAEYRHPNLTEWWVSRDDGLEQGFQIARSSGDGLLTLRLGVEGARALAVEATGARLTDAAGRVWTVSGLSAWDADDRPLRAWMEGGGDTLSLRVDAREARFPITVDPVYSTAFVTLTGPESDAWFGSSLAGVGDVNGDGYRDVLVGAPHTSGAIGEAFLYLGDAGGLDSEPALSFEGDEADGGFGAAVAGLGDVNGDGYDDFAIADALADDEQGLVHVFLGGPGGPDASPSLTLSGAAAGDLFGQGLDGAGDVNGDGYADLAVGAPGLDDGAGLIYVYHGSAEGLSARATSKLQVDEPDGELGYSISGAGDVNGDGFADLVGGAPGVGGGTGKAYVFYGSRDGADDSETSTLETDLAHQDLGTSVAGVGDVNGDGYDDIMVGNVNDPSPTGRAFLYNGAASGPSSDATTFEDSTPGSGFGTCVAAAGDVNGDGYADILIGVVAKVNSAHLRSGAALVFEGSADGPATDLSFNLEGVANGDAFGCAAASVGDIDGDTYDDLLVGAPKASSNAGTATVFLGYAADDDEDGYPEDTDCDDDDDQTFPGAVESCDGKDNNCDGAVLDDELDQDGDGWRACEGDCDDLDLQLAPLLEEIIGDGLDEDCDAVEICYVDADFDGARTEETIETDRTDCDGPGIALSSAELDCDDENGRRAPGLEEACDQVDNDCDYAIPEDERDRDDDGWTPCAGDCDDDDPGSAPGVYDKPLDGIDQDCDGLDDLPDSESTDTGDPIKTEGGCACATGQAPSPWPALLLTGLALLRRRPRKVPAMDS